LHVIGCPKSASFLSPLCFLKKGKMDNHQKWMAKAIEEAIKSAQN
jgi:hypothetical protein